MRIFWIHQNFVSSRQGGNCRAEQIIAAFLEAGHSVDIICTKESYFGDRISDSTENEIQTEGNLNIHRLSLDQKVKSGVKQRKTSYFSFLKKSISYLNNIPKPDIVYCTSPPLPQMISNLYASIKFKSTFIVEVRDLWPSFLIEGGLIKSGIATKILYFLESFMYHSSDHCISVSPGFEKYLLKMGIDKTSLTIAPTGADAKFNQLLNSKGLNWRKENNFENKFIVLYAGSLNEAYGTELLLEIAKDLSDTNKEIQFVIAGNGRGRDLVEEYSQKHNSITYLGSMPKDEIIHIIKQADAAINIHADWNLLETTITGKLFDYLSAGTPVISTCTGVMELIISNADAGIVVQRNHHSIKSAIQNLFDKEIDERKELGRNGNSWIFKNISASVMARRIVKDVTKTHSSSDYSFKKKLTAFFKAINDCLQNRSNKTVINYYNEKSNETIKTSFDHWINESLKENSRINTEQLKIPFILSEPTND